MKDIFSVDTYDEIIVSNIVVQGKSVKANLLLERKRYIHRVTIDNKYFCAIVNIMYYNTVSDSKECRVTYGSIFYYKYTYNNYTVS